MDRITKVVTIDGNDVQFPRLTLRDMGPVADIVVAGYEKQARALAQEQAVTGLDLYNVLITIRMNRPTYAELYNNNAPQTDTVVALITVSCRKAGFDQAKIDSILDAISIPDAMMLGKLLILDVQEKLEKPLPLPVPPSIGGDQKNGPEMAASGNPANIPHFPLGQK